MGQLKRNDPIQDYTNVKFGNFGKGVAFILLVVEGVMFMIHVAPQDPGSVTPIKLNRQR